MGIKILIVDDSAFMRNMLKNLITSSGGEVVGEAVDGNDAIEKFKQSSPQLVFLDIMMPNKNGLDALKEIMAINPEAKVVMCTSVGQEKVVMEAVEAGASDYIVKPFKQDDIKAVLEKYS
ncbi:response regulator [Candidatus Woesearchaeota archaeon]|nr:response regulator [Candidatus Woesearchaeota archaeon]